MPSFRKRIAQLGVILFAAQMLGLYFVYPFAFLFLFLAAILPADKRDEWGSMWPLVGYDNAIDGIYTRGPWLMRFQELEELEEERRVTEGLATLFGGP